MREFIEALEKLCNDPIGSLHTFAFQQEKPDGVDIEDDVFAEMKRVQLITGSDSPGLGSPV